jgi:hypothetical protein
MSYPELVGGLESPALEAIGARYVAELRKLQPDARHIAEKMPANFFFAGLIHLVLPNARIIIASAIRLIRASRAFPSHSPRRRITPMIWPNSAATTTVIKR